MKQDNSKTKKLSTSGMFRKRKAFSLAEVLVTVFVFSIVMVAVTSIMANVIAVKKRAQSSAQNLEEARFAMESMAKTLRSSKIFSCGVGNEDCTESPKNSIETFDYSQGKCIQYSFNSEDKKIYHLVGTGDSEACNFDSSLAVSMIEDSSKIEDVNFGVVKPVDTGTDVRPGIVCILLEICSNYGKNGSCVADKNDNFPIQMTVLLRY